MARRSSGIASSSRFDPLRVVSFRDAIDHLRVAYRRGQLVPFLGSGLSAGVVPMWSGLVRALARRARLTDLRLGKDPTDQQLIVASERVVAKLNGMGRGVFAATLEKIVQHPASAAEIPPATSHLASVWWPLVVTTNYDRLFLRAFDERHSHGNRAHYVMGVVGRSARDAHVALASLSVPQRPLLWALQGFFGESINGSDLRSELVLGYDQYRRATFDNSSFRAAFSELYRNRLLLFAGAGLAEDYFRGLFDESLVRLGANQHAHCALVNERDLGRVSPWLLHARLNIIVITYRDPTEEPYSGFAPCLRELADALSEPPGGRRDFLITNRRGAPLPVQIMPAPLPTISSRKHWIVGSAQRWIDGSLVINSDVKRPSKPRCLPIQEHANLLRVSGTHVLVAVGPRAGGKDSRDLRLVADLTTQALTVAARGGCEVVSLMLLGASAEGGRWPRIFSLVQMLRGIRAFAARRSEARPMSVRLHDTAAAYAVDEHRREISAWAAIESGRFDPAEVLECRDVRCFVEIDSGDASMRATMYVSPAKKIRELAGYFLVDGSWSASVEPSYAEHASSLRADSRLSLAAAGVVPGSTIRFERSG
jgi:hypothetical protein